jgi:uncharacterized membrane protein YraQ (UPF0718 family)
MIREPFFQFATRFGVEDRVLAAFMLAGPVVILAFALLGRTALTAALAAAYVGLFVLYVASKGVASDE